MNTGSRHPPTPPPPGANPVRIFLADDHTLFRAALRCLLEREPEFLVVGEADEGQSAVRLVLQLVPDVILIDISMPEMNGIEATRLILSQARSLKVVALSMYSNRYYIKEMLQAGAVGYILKTSAEQDLVAAIRAVQADQFYFSPQVARCVQADHWNTPLAVPGEAGAVLTPHEQQVLRLLSEGKNNKEIAAHLDLSTKTVDVYRRRLMDKLGLRSIAELTKYAITQGITSVDF